MSTASPHIPLVATIPHWPHTSAPLPDAQHRHRHHAKRNQLHNKNAQIRIISARFVANIKKSMYFCQQLQ